MRDEMCRIALDIIVGEQFNEHEIRRLTPEGRMDWTAHNIALVARNGCLVFWHGDALCYYVPKEEVEELARVDMPKEVCRPGVRMMKVRNEKMMLIDILSCNTEFDGWHKNRTAED